MVFSMKKLNKKNEKKILKTDGKKKKKKRKNDGWIAKIKEIKKKKRRMGMWHGINGVCVGRMAGGDMQVVLAFQNFYNLLNFACCCGFCA